MPTILHYLDIPGRGEPTRVALAVAGVYYEDRRLSFEEFGTSRFKHLPVLEVGSEVALQQALQQWEYRIRRACPLNVHGSLKVESSYSVEELLSEQQ